jgi:hypothetical protein
VRGEGNAMGGLEGSKLYQKRAKQALPLLVAQAKAGNTITYGQLALEMEMPNPRNLNHVLGTVGDELKALSKKWKQKIPPINCLVINKQKKTPQRGIGFHMSADKFKKLSRSRQQEVLHELDRDIWDYPRWDDVLLHFRLPPAVPAKSRELQAIAAKAKYGKGGGETDDHRKLKEFVKGNPQVLGLSARLNGEKEYSFLSADKIDVLFRSSSKWIGVEVKGIRSDEADIMRGIFQCVKYKALMEAAQRFEQADVDSRVMLVLGGKLPQPLRRVVALLKIEVKEEITVPADS